MFFGFYLSAATMTREENGTAVPELARRMTLCSCALDPVRAFAAVLLRMAAAGTPPGDILDDSGYPQVPRALARPGRSTRAPATRHAQDHLSPPGTCAPAAENVRPKRENGH